MVNYENAEVRALYVCKDDERTVIAVCDDRLIIHCSGRNVTPIKWYIPFENMYLLQSGTLMYREIDTNINYVLINRLSKLMDEKSVFIDKETGNEIPFNIMMAKVIKFYIIKMGDNAMNKIIAGLKFDGV